MATQSNNKSKATKAPAPVAQPVSTAVKASPAKEPVKAKAPYEPTQEEIQTRAFQIYLSEGCKEGNDLEFWLRAEKELRR
jgi:Protein of unknown function (DUF2934)